MNRRAAPGDLIHPANDLRFASEIHARERCAPAKLIGQRLAGISIRVAKENVRVLRVKRTDNGGADAIGAACD
jgi:hypothetical protein